MRDGLHPEINDDDPAPIQGVVEHAGKQPDLHQAEEGQAVELDDLVVQVRPQHDEGRIEDMREEEDEDGHAGHAMRQPRPLPDPTAIHYSTFTYRVLSGTPVS